LQFRKAQEKQEIPSKKQKGEDGSRAAAAEQPKLGENFRLENVARKSFSFPKTPVLKFIWILKQL